MTRPTPEPVVPGQVRERALAVVCADRFPYLATADGCRTGVQPGGRDRTAPSAGDVGG